LPVIQALRVLKVKRAHREAQVLKALQDLPVIQALRVLKVKRVHREAQVLKVFQG
jgi:hypothetical protein